MNRYAWASGGLVPPDAFSFRGRRSARSFERPQHNASSVSLEARRPTWGAALSTSLPTTMKTTESLDPLAVIETLRDAHPNIFNIFMEGSCFRFCLLMELIFDEDVQEILYSQQEGHWIIRIGDDFYDIGGEIKKEFVQGKDYKTWSSAHESAYLASAGRAAPYEKYANVKTGSLITK